MNSDIIVLPISEDSYNEKDNSLDLTMFVSFNIKDGVVNLLPPLDISKETDFNLNPIGFENFLPKDISEKDFINVLKNMIVNNLNYKHSFKNKTELSSFRFLDMDNTFLAYPTKISDKPYFISVLKINLSLNTFDFDFNVFNIVEMKGLDVENVINYVDNTLKINEMDLDLEQKDLHDIALKLQFSTFNEEFMNNLSSLLQLYIVSQPHITKK